MSEVVCKQSQEEYEDDFEKDLDWLISEESRSEDQVSNSYMIIGQANCISPFYFLLFVFLNPPASLFYCVKLSLECCSAYCRLGAAWVPDPAL